MAQESIPTYLKNSINRSGVIGQLIAINVVIYLVVFLVSVVGKLALVENLQEIITSQLAAPGDPKELLYRPWSIITQMFMHGSFMHLFFNMFSLYFIGRLFVQFLGEKRLITTYFIGGLFGYIIHLIGSHTIPFFIQTNANDVIGASGSVMALLAAAAFHKPQLKVKLYGLISVPLIYLGLAFILMDLAFLTSDDNTAHLVHLGGAIFGALSIVNVLSPKQFMNKLDKLFTWKFSFKNLFKRKPKMKVYKGDARKMTDDEYNANKKAIEERTNAILDKIAKKGYDGLSKAEKEFLFDQSKKNNP